MAMFEWPCPYVAVMRGWAELLGTIPRTQQHFSCLRATVDWAAGAGAPLAILRTNRRCKRRTGIVCGPIEEAKEPRRHRATRWKHVPDASGAHLPPASCSDALPHLAGVPPSGFATTAAAASGPLLLTRTGPLNVSGRYRGR